MNAKKTVLSAFVLLCFACNINREDVAENIQIEDFEIIGIAIETTNENAKAMVDMSEIWEKFYSENISSAIPNKASDDIYSLYTDYESDYRGVYTAIIGCKVNSLDSIPNGLIGRAFKGGKYKRYIAKGEMPDAVVNTWKEIWSKDEELNRKYTVDFEVYRLPSQNPSEEGVEILIAVD